MNQTTSDVSSEADSEPDMSLIPDSLKCEQCGVKPVNVIVTWMAVNQCDRLCTGCYLATATAVVISAAGLDTGE